MCRVVTRIHQRLAFLIYKCTDRVSSVGAVVDEPETDVRGSGPSIGRSCCSDETSHLAAHLGANTERGQTGIRSSVVAIGVECTTLGDTGMTVSKICLGCMSFGGSGGGEAFDRTVGEDQATEVIDRAIELGIDFFDIIRTRSVLISCQT